MNNIGSVDLGTHWLVSSSDAQNLTKPKTTTKTTLVLVLVSKWASLVSRYL